MSSSIPSVSLAHLIKDCVLQKPQAVNKPVFLSLRWQEDIALLIIRVSAHHSHGSLLCSLLSLIVINSGLTRERLKEQETSGKLFQVNRDLDFKWFGIDSLGTISHTQNTLVCSCQSCICVSLKVAVHIWGLELWLLQWKMVTCA